MLKNMINDLIQQFENRFNPIASFLINQEMFPSVIENQEFIQNIKSLEKLVLERKFDRIAEKVFSQSKYQEKAKKLRSIDALYEIFLETKAVLDLVEKSESLEDNSHLMRDFQTAKMEGAMANFNSSSKTVFIGSGPFPSTAIAYMKTFGCRVTCVDNNPEAVMLSQRMLEQLKLSSKIIPVFCNGEEFNYKKFTHVVLAGIAEPKDKILQRIFETARRDIKVVSRTTDGLRRFFYQPIKTPENFGLVNQVVDENNIFYSVLLKIK